MVTARYRNEEEDGDCNFLLAHLAIFDQRVNCVAFNGDQSVLISGSYDTTVKIWWVTAMKCRLQEMFAT